MTREDLVELLAERPFIPQRLHLSNGRSHDIMHPEMAIVSDWLVAIGVPRDEDPSAVGRIRLCDLRHVVEAEPLRTADAAPE